MATIGMSDTEREAVERFERDVIQPSMTSLVVLQFTASWCGPCKQLTPILDKVAADYSPKGVTLVRVDVDEDKLIAAQFRIQSVPTVYAIFQGQPVADLTNYRTEGQLGQALDQLLAQLPVKSDASELKSRIEPQIAMGEEALAAGDAARAADILADVWDMAPGDPAIAGPFIRALVADGKVDSARTLLDSLDDKVAADAGVQRAKAALELAATPVADTSAEEARLATDPDDHEARFAIAEAALAAGHRDRAADELLALIERDREWNGGAARAKLLQVLEAAGFEDPWGRGVRRRLSALLFT